MNNRFNKMNRAYNNRSAPLQIFNFTLILSTIARKLQTKIRKFEADCKYFSWKQHKKQGCRPHKEYELE